MDEIQIVLALAVIYIIYKWTSRPSSSSSSSSSNIDRLNTLARSIPPASLEQAQSLFPHLDERSLRWQFVKTGRLNTLENVAQSLLDDSPRSRSSNNADVCTHLLKKSQIVSWWTSALASSRILATYSTSLLCTVIDNTHNFPKFYSRAHKASEIPILDRTAKSTSASERTR